MEVKWTNVVAFGLALFAAVLAIRHHGEVGAALASLGQIGPGHTPKEQFRGFFVLAVLAVALVAIVRLVIHADRRNKDQ